MPFDHGLRLDNRQRIANAREKPIKANKNHAVDGAEGLFLRSGSPQNIYLLPQHPNFRFERGPRSKQINDHPNNEPNKISHPVTASTDSRSTASQIEFTTGTPLKEAGCDVIRSEKRSGTTTAGRAELQTILDFLRPGDILLVTRIDRLARSIGDLQDIARALKVKGASLKATEQPIDTSTAAGKAFLDMLGVFAEFETNLRRERQLEGIAKAKEAGVYRGRPASISADRVRELKAQGLGPTEIARTMGIGRASVYRALGETTGGQ